MVTNPLTNLITRFKKLAPYRLWHYKKESEESIKNIQESTKVRKTQESIILRDYLNNLDPRTRRFALARMEDAEKNEEMLKMVLAAKISCARELLDQNLLIASALIMKQITGWYCQRNRPMPRTIVEIALLTIQAQTAEANV